MDNINLKTGVKTFNINGVCEISFNPADLETLEKINSLFTTLEAENKKFLSKKKKANTKEIFAIARQMDQRARDGITDIFGVDVCTAVFGKMNVYATNGEGLPLWAGLLIGILDAVAEETAAEQEMSAADIAKKSLSPAALKYLEKYHEEK